MFARASVSTMASLIAYVSALVAILLLGWTLASLRPLSPLRPFMLSLILAAATVTAVTAPTSSANSTWNCFIGLYFGALIVVEAIDHVCISRLYFDAEKSTKDGNTGLLAVVRWTADAIFNKRKIGSPRQVKNVPQFDSKRPEYVPTRTNFLLFRIARFILTFLSLDFLITMPAPDPQEQFAKEKEPLFGRIAAGELTVDAFVERAIMTSIFWFLSYATQLAVSDLFSIICTGSFLNNPADWPPRFGSVSDAYTIRRFWGVFWHQELRQSLTSNSTVIVHQIFHIPKNSLVGRYANLFSAFFISGLIHINNDRFLKVAPRESGALYFFPVQAVAILVEDAVQHVFRRASSKTKALGSSLRRPPLWQRSVGYIWVLLFLTWQTPFWTYPVMREDNPLPVSSGLFNAPT